MYIIYCRNQKTVDLEDKTNYRLSVTGGDYRPTWLVRVSDWKKVPGTEAVDGYHTISYCWEQSGEVVKNETDDEYSLVDNGKHCIIEGYQVYEDEIYRLVDFPNTEDDVQEVEEEDDDVENLQHENNDANKEEHQEDRQKDNKEKDKEDPSKNNFNSDEEEEAIGYKEYVSWCEPTSETATARYVTYGELLQQVCKDFQVEYVWYDKICIDQEDHKAKLSEIQQMHKVYSNARYTIAIIPEVRRYNQKDLKDDVGDCAYKALGCLIDDAMGSCWFKRSWTLEEVMMSRRILIVGANTNMFQHSLFRTDIPTTLDIFSGTLLDFGGRAVTQYERGTVNQALAHAHFRTSTKPQDVIHSLKNIFYYMFYDIEASHSTDIKTIFNNFYRHVTTIETSILCFGSPYNLAGYIMNENMMHDYNLPSWTGVNGRHVRDIVIALAHPQLEYHIDDTMFISTTTKYYWKISITPYDRGCYSPSRPDMEEHSSILDEMDRVHQNRINGEGIDMTTANKDVILLAWLRKILITTNLYMTHYYEPQDGLITQIRPLSLTEDCEECIILPILCAINTPIHIPVEDDKRICTIAGYSVDYCFPVLQECTKGTGRYRAIGIYYIGESDWLSGDPTFQWNHSIGKDDISGKGIKEIVNILFENHAHDVPKEFIIE
ncbi:hypothetical protein INT45_009339 [Circinella minor]|uniref:Heterokaryon incompatibility domain-containing protein n=1 Tax=Circinella minor TaxID=1195481 RepID=A0A8H7RVT2_9FUNG|nr:hypothetical protein INT45_009339 [Circinella minor]